MTTVLPANVQLTAAEEVDITADHQARTVQFLINTQLPYQIWKETEPEFFWIMERLFGAWRCVVRFTGDERTHLVELELPLNSVGKIEKAIKEGTLAMEIDKVHGLDPILHKGKKDFNVSLAPARPQNVETRRTIEALERRLLDIELAERSRSIDLRVIMRDLQGFQVEMYRKFEDLEKKMDDGLFGLGVKCEKMERAVQKYRPS